MPKIPKLRFKGFSDDWANVRLGDVCDVKTGYPFNGDSFNDNGEYLVITNGNIQHDSSIVINSIGNRININGLYHDYILNYNDILVTMDGTVGRTAKVVEEKQILAQRVGRVIAKINPEFIYQFLNTGRFFEKMTLLAHGGTIKHISLSEIVGYTASFPLSLQEQQKIGDFFQKIDTLIDLKKRELEKLQNIKKACLAQMFI